MNITIPLACALFYGLLLTGAIVRVRRNKNRYTLMQFWGVILPLFPATFLLAQLMFGFQLFGGKMLHTLFFLYGAAWMLMGVGYVLEGFAYKKEK